MADRNDEIESILGNLAVARSRAEAEADAAAREIVRAVGLDYDPERFDDRALLATVGQFLAAHQRALALREACREINRRRIG